MIVPMKKVSLIVLEQEKERALQELRRLGLVHIEISQGSGGRLAELKEQKALLESGIFAVSEKANKKTVTKKADGKEALAIAEKVQALTEERKTCYAEISLYQAELERLKDWGEVDPDQLQALAEKGIELILCEIPVSEYDKVKESAATLVLSRTKNLVRALVVSGKEKAENAADEQTENAISLGAYRVELPKASTAEIRQKKEDAQKRVLGIEEELAGYACYMDSMKAAVGQLEKHMEFETYATGMEQEALSEGAKREVSVAYFSGYIPAEDMDKLKALAAKQSWGLASEDPTPEDNVPTQLRNNKLVSLIYPLTDFLGTVPGYFEYDISGWFLGFILIFFGIIFGDGGYGLLICAAAGGMMAMSYKKDKTFSATSLLVMLLGLATVVWGTLTCTWFGLAPEQLPGWLQAISIPVISNVYEDKIWYPFWTNGEVGLTTAQNVQIFCFALALIQLTVAHIKGMIRNRDSLKMFSDLGSILQLFGIFYVVLALVVNGEIFGLGLVISGIPVGMIAIGLVAVGFLLSFVFANYDGDIKASILESCKNIVSVLLGVVNVFSDIVSYIRLWAVGLAGAAISTTVNDLAGPFLGDLTFIVFAIILLVFGHGLNMILNVLSVIVHGVRLNTLEFSSHLDMSWSGHKYDPFRE